MILALLLIAGAGLWLAGDLIALGSGAIGVGDGWLTTLGMTLAGTGIWSFRHIAGHGRAGRVGIVLTSFGAFSFAMVMIITLTSGVLGAMEAGEFGYGAIAVTPFFLLALVFVFAGLVALAIHCARSGGSGKPIAAALAVVAIFQLVRPFAGDAFEVQLGVQAMLAAALLIVGIAVLRTLWGRVRPGR